METDTCKRELVIEIPPDIVRKESESKAAEIARKARVPGFRPGRAPRDLILRRYRDAIREEVAQVLLPKFFGDAVKEQQYSVVGKPSFEELKFEDDQPLKAKVSFEVLPAIELGEYKGLEIAEDDAAVSEAEVEKALEQRREQAATYEVADSRAAEDGDLLSVDYEAWDSKLPSQRLFDVKDGTVRIGEEHTVPEFSANLRAARTGDTREFEVNYPDNFPEPKVAGKRVHFQVHVLAVKRRIVPALDDELAKTVSEFSTLDELRSSIRKELEARKGREAEAASKQKLLEVLAGRKAFPIPEVLVEERLDQKLKMAAGQLIDQGIDLRATGIDWHGLRASLRDDAMRDVRSALILEKLADEEAIEVSPEETDDVIRELAAGGEETAAALKTRLTQNGGLARLQSNRRNLKALDFLYRSAKILRSPSPADSSPSAGVEQQP
ncbi:MAG: trigger factor [Terriglobia bacterium]